MLLDFVSRLLQQQRARGSALLNVQKLVEPLSVFLKLSQEICIVGWLYCGVERDCGDLFHVVVVVVSLAALAHARVFVGMQVQLRQTFKLQTAQRMLVRLGPVFSQSLSLLLLGGLNTAVNGLPSEQPFDRAVLSRAVVLFIEED